MRGALVWASPPRAMASSISSDDASRAEVQSGNLALSEANVRSVFTSAVFWLSTVNTSSSTGG
jgi:hypothetical protein